MRKSPISRIFSACFALWFVFALAEPVLAMHDCPVHDGVASGAAVAHHAGHGAPHKQHSAHNCSCIGDCAGCTAPALHSSGNSYVIDAVTYTASAPGTFAVRYIASWAQHVLPFQNGPPAA